MRTNNSGFITEEVREGGREEVREGKGEGGKR